MRGCRSHASTSAIAVPPPHYNARMKRDRNKGRGRMAREGERLVALAQRLSASGSRLEDTFWERELDTLLIKLLRAGNGNTVDTALDHLFATDAAAYGLLLDQCDSTAESQVATHDGAEHDLMLVVAPILAWTRFAIPSGPVRAAVTEA